MGVVRQGSPRIDRSGIGRRHVTAKVAIPVVLLCAVVGAVLGLLFPPERLVSRPYQAAYQREADQSPLAPAEERPVATAPVATATEEPIAHPAPVPPSTSTIEPSVHAVSPAELDEAKSPPVSRTTTEKIERRSAPRRKARPEREAPAKRKQYAAPSTPAPTKQQTPSIASRLSEQWWR